MMGREKECLMMNMYSAESIVGPFSCKQLKNRMLYRMYFAGLMVLVKIGHFQYG